MVVTTAVSRIAASGAPVDLVLPEALGDLRWYGSTRFSGPRTARQFFLAPAGEHRAVPTHALPGATRRVEPMRGFDAVLFEARDRSDAALVLAGPHHEATTWFGGPAPDAAGLSALLTGLRFTDSPRGAALTPVSDMTAAQRDTSLIARSRDATLVVRPAADALPALPDWAGAALPGGEMWRAERVLDPGSTAAVAGTPHRWRYLFAGDSVAMDLVLHGPEAGRSRTALSDDAVASALASLAGSWAARR
jgi:hypothetical protein